MKLKGVLNEVNNNPQPCNGPNVQERVVNRMKVGWSFQARKITDNRAASEAEDNFRHTAEQLKHKKCTPLTEVLKINHALSSTIRL